MTSNQVKVTKPRLYVNAIFSGYQRNQRVQHENHSLLRIEGVKTKQEAEYYLGKSVAFIYKAHRPRPSKLTGKITKLRVIWGTITRTHGTGNGVRAKFARNLPAHGMGKFCRIMMYPTKY